MEQLEITAIIFAILSFTLFIMPFLGVRVFFALNGFFLHFLRVISLILIVIGLNLIFEEKDTDGKMSGIGIIFDYLYGFIYVILGFNFITSTQLVLETHSQIVKNKKRIEALASIRSHGKKEITEKKSFESPKDKLQVFCPNCKQEILPTTLSCPNCNESLVNKTLKGTICKLCGTKITDFNAEVCNNCGNTL